MMRSTCDKEGFYLREFFVIKTNGVGMINEIKYYGIL